MPISPRLLFRRFLRQLLVFGCLSVFLLAPVARSAEAVTLAALQIEEPWARATVASQEATGAYMRLTSREALTITGVRSPVARRAEIHMSEIEDGVMKMRAIPELSLSAGETAVFRPGGLHIMLFGLKRAVEAGQRVPLVLTFIDARGVRHEHKLEAEARSLKAEPPARHQHN